jgi:TPR repeat protein
MGGDVERNIKDSIKYYTMAADTGSGMAQFQLAILYLKNSNYIEAYILLKQAKDQGYVHVKHLFQFPIDYDLMINDYSKVTDMFIEVTESEIDDLHYHIGYIYEHGIDAFGQKGVKVNHGKAEEWYLAASKKGDSRADYRLGIMYEYEKGVEEHLDTAINYYEKASSKGIQDAKYRLACMYFDGYGVTQDLLKAFQYFTEASTMGHKEASKAMVISDSGLNTMLKHEDAYGRYILKEVNEDVKLSMLENATNEGFTRLQYQLGLIFLRKRDYLNAFKWLGLAADVGVTDAYYELGHFYKGGNGSAQDYTMAIKVYQKAMEKEHKDACYQLGELYRLGQGVGVDYLKAYYFYKKAADMGHTEAHKILALVLETDFDLNRYASGNYFKYHSNEYRKYIPMLTYVATHGDNEVQFRLGFAYEHDILMTPYWESEYEEACKWYRMAVGSSHKEAMYHLGLLYENGLGVLCDYRKANRLYQQAGELGSDDALYQPGNTYRHGKGVKSNPERQWNNTYDQQSLENQRISTHLERYMKRESLLKKIC